MAEEIGETEEEVPNSEGLTGIKKLLANKMIVIAVAVILILILAVGAYFLFFSGSDEEIIEEEDVIVEEPFKLEGEQIEIDIDPIEGDDIPIVETPEEESELIADIIKKGTPQFNKNEETSAKEANTNSSDSALLQQLEALKKQNEELKNYIKDRDQQADMPKKDLSVPIDRMIGTETDETPAKAAPTQDNPYMYLDDYDESSNYYSSPYADDEQVPEPTWGE